MTGQESSRLALYEDLGPLNENKKLHLKKSLIYGQLCVEKHVSKDCLEVYRALCGLKSEYVPKIYECIPAEGHLIIIEEYIDGATLEELIADGPMPESAACGVICELCRALLPLHRLNPPIICRDLKAENIMADKTSHIKIVDFDIARIYEPDKNRDTRLLGTKEYAAPEQFGFGQTDPRTDIYSLGVLLNYLITRRFPIEETAPWPYFDIIQKCTRMDPEQRYQSVDELMASLLALPRTKRRFSDPGPDGQTKKEGPYAASPEETKAAPKDAGGTNGSIAHTDRAKVPEDTGGAKGSTARPVGARSHRRSLSREDADSIHRKSFLPPGFRTCTPWKMLASSGVYLLLAVFIYSIELTDQGEILAAWQLRFEQTMIFISQLLFIFIACDWRGIRQRLPLVKNSCRIVRLIGYAVYEVCLFVAFIWLSVIIESLLI